MKRTGRVEPIGIVIYICIETTQGHSLCSYPFVKLANTPCFSVLGFFFYKIEEQESRVLMANNLSLRNYQEH
jgi:hypothetical protein